MGVVLDGLEISVSWTTTDDGVVDARPYVEFETPDAQVGTRMSAADLVRCIGWWRALDRGPRRLRGPIRLGDGARAITLEATRTPGGWTLALAGAGRVAPTHTDIPRDLPPVVADILDDGARRHQQALIGARRP